MIKQKKLTELKAHLACWEITLLTGPRQAGKTTLLKFLETELKNSGKRTLFLNQEARVRAARMKQNRKEQKYILFRFMN